jgi:hypothetical protein
MNWEAFTDIDVWKSQYDSMGATFPNDLVREYIDTCLQPRDESLNASGSSDDSTRPQVGVASGNWGAGPFLNAQQERASSSPSGDVGASDSSKAVDEENAPYALYPSSEFDRYAIMYTLYSPTEKDKIPTLSWTPRKVHPSYGENTGTIVTTPDGATKMSAEVPTRACIVPPCGDPFRLILRKPKVAQEIFIVPLHRQLVMPTSELLPQVCLTVVVVRCRQVASMICPSIPSCHLCRADLAVPVLVLSEPCVAVTKTITLASPLRWADFAIPFTALTSHLHSEPCVAAPTRKVTTKVWLSLPLQRSDLLAPMIAFTSKIWLAYRCRYLPCHLCLLNGPTRAVSTPRMQVQALLIDQVCPLQVMFRVSSRTTDAVAVVFTDRFMRCKKWYEMHHQISIELLSLGR